jgi:asparagine synthetase A
MKQTINEWDFQDAFRKMDRENNFSRAALQALFDHFEEIEEETSEEIELDVIAICCDYTEFSDIEEFWTSYNKEDYPDMESIEYETTVISILDSDSFIIQNF